MPRGTPLKVDTVFDSTVLNFIIPSGSEEGSEPYPRWHNQETVEQKARFGASDSETVRGVSWLRVSEVSWLVHGGRRPWQYNTEAKPRVRLDILFRILVVSRDIVDCDQLLMLFCLAVIAE